MKTGCRHQLGSKKTMLVTVVCLHLVKTQLGPWITAVKEGDESPP